MAELTIDLTYGHALFSAAKEVDKTALIREEAKAVLEVIEREPDLLAFLYTPAVSAKDKKAVIGSIFEGRVCTELLNLLYILIDKGRTRHFGKIIQTFEDLINKEEGLSYGKILSVAPLTESQLRKFEEQTGKLFRRKVKLDNEQDPGLIGGVKIYVDGKLIDASIKGRLRELRTAMEQ